MAKIQANEIKMVDVSQVVPNPKNPNKHPKNQIDRLMKLIRAKGFRVPLIVSNQSGFLVAGHGRLEAAIKLEMETIPVIYQDFENEADEYAFMTADNALAGWAALDLSAINSEILEFGPDFDLDFLGIEGFTLDVADKLNGDAESIYTSKIEAPIYEPKGPCPQIKDCYDLEKANQLIEEINKSDISPELKRFMTAAAMRHAVFDYQNIAELYAHAHPDLKVLMEKSALVIIDFNKAIEEGFVVMTKELAEGYGT